MNLSTSSGIVISIDAAILNKLDVIFKDICLEKIGEPKSLENIIKVIKETLPKYKTPTLNNNCTKLEFILPNNLNESAVIEKIKILLNVIIHLSLKKQIDSKNNQYKDHKTMNFTVKYLLKLIIFYFEQLISEEKLENIVSNKKYHESTNENILALLNDMLSTEMGKSFRIKLVLLLETLRIFPKSIDYLSRKERAVESCIKAPIKHVKLYWKEPESQKGFNF